MFSETSSKEVAAAYELARRQYARLGVDADAALAALGQVPISLHCWQGDDVKGLETRDEAVSGGGTLATGNYPGAARNGTELRMDAERAMSLIPGELRFNVHACYAETGGERVDRDQLKPEHFRTWMDWAKKHNLRLDFNGTFFAHPLANGGFTLSDADEEVRAFWVRHGIASRMIAEAMGREQGGPCILNHWIPDGAKDSPIDRWAPRQRLMRSLDEMLGAPVDRAFCLDCVEGKLFGISSEDFVVGSHEFYMNYTASRRNARLCLDMGHFHPTETIHDKISAVLSFQDGLLIHVSRGIRWDSDHVVVLNDDLRALFQEIVRGGALDRVNIALDYFDASMNRVGAWVIGTRCTQKAILAALLEPSARLRELEARGDMASKLAVLEELKTLPLGAVWDQYCHAAGAPVGPAWLNAMHDYEEAVQRPRAKAKCGGGCACG